MINLRIGLRGAFLATALVAAPLAAQNQSETKQASGKVPDANETPSETEASTPDIIATYSGKEFEGKRSREILIAQVLLDRNGHSPGVIDGYDGGNTQRALRAFRRVNELDSSASIDRAALQKLADGHSNAILTSYTISSQDTSGPFKAIPDSMQAKAKVDSLGFTSVLELLGEKFHVTPGLLRTLNPEAKWSEGEQITVIDPGSAMTAKSVARIEVDKAGSEVRAYDDEDQLLVTYPATVGSQDFPSPSGSMKVIAIAARPNYTFDPSDQEWGGEQALMLPPGPNNPVGGTWIDLGKNGYGIHGSPDPSDIGKTASHGCVRLTNWDAAELAKAVQPGTTVVDFL